MTHSKIGKGNGRVKDPSAAAELRRIASANYYQKNADTIREKRRIQMAEKRCEREVMARIKANRRKSDKPKLLRTATSRAVSAPPRIITFTERTGRLASLSPSQQPMNRVENKDVPNRSVSPTQDRMRSREEENERGEHKEEIGMRTISEVAEESPGSASSDDQDWQLSPITQGQEQHEEQIASSSSHLYIFISLQFSPLKRSCRRIRRRYWTPPIEDDPLPGPQPRLPSFISYLEDHMCGQHDGRT
ncbi:hypothetical protein R3P38DRAFT_2772607 [Favolaschia claudopus]|uniref:Uncharacterized protein n=1 Tax=Favolaschia claudopus TaxID=2862362 RepID=A0AAW0C5B7_9AGAR